MHDGYQLLICAFASFVGVLFRTSVRFQVILNRKIRRVRSLRSVAMRSFAPYRCYRSTL